MNHQRRLAVIALAASVALVLTGCAAVGGSGGAIDDYAGPPKGVSPVPVADSSYATWLSDGQRIAITLFGSSGCPPVVERLTVGSSNSLRATVTKIPPDIMCTADYAPHTTVMHTPSEVTPSSDVSIRVAGQPTITLTALR